MKRLFALQFAALFLGSSLIAQNLHTIERSRLSFPGQSLANVWGYKARDGKEYALLGGSKGLIVVDISDPEEPKQIVQVPGPDNLWKEIKTYSHYAYIVSEGGSGIQIVDLSALPSSDLDYHYYRGDGLITNQLNKIHALHIDVTKGFLYAWGGDLFGGSAKIFDLKKDPYNPTYVGKFDQLGYIHDGFVDNDTMYSGHIYAGQFAMVNMTDKSAPELLATQGTPFAFTHNLWPSDDRKTLFTTDERFGAFLASYDISNPEDIKFLDKIQSNPGSNSAPHNVHINKNWAVTSWYTDGFTIVDITRPGNLVQVGNFDSYAGSGSGFEGCWGVHPHLPSGNIIVTNIHIQGTNTGEMVIVTPEYRRASYLEGKVVNAQTGMPLTDVTVEVLDSAGLVVKDGSASNGVFKTGHTRTGYLTVRLSKTNYTTYETIAYFAEGEVVNINAGLYPNDNLNVYGHVVNAQDDAILDGASVSIFGNPISENTTTDIDGYFSFTGIKPGIYHILASKPGFGIKFIAGVEITADQEFTLKLSSFGHENGGKPGQLNNEDGSFIATGSNPFKDYTTLLCNAPVESELSIFDGTGRIVEQIELTGASSEINLGHSYSKGLYYARLSHSGIVLQTKKLLKVD
jgi:choice-of-anchor B domain-containing protein